MVLSMNVGVSYVVIVAPPLMDSDVNVLMFLDNTTQGFNWAIPDRKRGRPHAEPTFSNGWGN